MHYEPMEFSQAELLARSCRSGRVAEALLRGIDQLRMDLAQIDDLAFAILAAEGDEKREAQNQLGDLLARRIGAQLRDVLGEARHP